MKFAFIFLLIFSFMSVGCGPSPEAIQTMVEETVSAIPTQTPYPTYTPYPTFTPLPTFTPTPTLTPTPVYARWNSVQVAEVFKSAGLEVGEYRPMTVEDFGAAPLVAIEGTQILIPSLCATCGGRILSFETQGNLDATKAYYDALGSGSAILFSWTFTKDNILVQINGTLPEEKARAYETALSNLK